MDAVKYIETLERMLEDMSITWEEFNAATPERKVEIVEKWGRDNVTQEELYEQRDRLFDMLNIMVERLWLEFHELAERIEIVEDKIQGLLSDD